MNQNRNVFLERKYVSAEKSYTDDYLDSIIAKKKVEESYQLCRHFSFLRPKIRRKKQNESFLRDENIQSIKRWKY
jgi:hypothetical protein